jgi:hypothetical protein
MPGHASIKITMATYSHLLPNSQGDEIRRLQRLFSAGSQEGVATGLPSGNGESRVEMGEAG